MARMLQRLARPAPPPRLIDRLARPLDAVMRALFEETLAGKAIVDSAGRIVRVNTALRTLLGGAVASTPGEPALQMFAAADRALVEACLQAALADRSALPPPGRLPQAPRPCAVRLADTGDGLRVLIAATALREADGTISGAILRVRDMSLEASLEHQLEQSQRLQVAGQLAGGVAHDFNNLLTAIIGATDAITQRDALDPATRDDLATIRASADRGAALVRHLLAFGRQQSLSPQPLAVNAVISDLASVLRRVLPSSIRLELALEQPGGWVQADPTALDQVLLNLSVNARDAMPGGGTLTLRSGRLTLHRPLPRGGETIQPGSYALIEVQDTGAGIAPDVLPHIFDPFFTTRREQGGNGLGLSTVHGIVRQSEGFLAVDSEPGLGTRMRVYLPLRPAPEAARPALPPPEPQRAAAPAPAPRGTILLVDDEDTVLRIAERSLRGQGWRVLAASSAEAALQTLADGDAAGLAAVVTDLVMPGMDGAALVRELRRQCGCPDLPAILVSGYAAEQLQREVTATLGDSEDGRGGRTRFLAKPYDMRELAAELADLLAPAEVLEANG